MPVTVEGEIVDAPPVPRLPVTAPPPTASPLFIPVMSPDEIPLSRRGDYEMHITPGDTPVTGNTEQSSRVARQGGEDPQATVGTVCSAIANPPGIYADGYCA